MTAKRLTLTQTRIANGVWEGVLTGTVGAAALEASHQGQRLQGLTLSPVAGQSGTHAVKLPIPATVLSDGVQTVLIKADGDVLASFTLVAGQPLEDDLRSEINLMRAELDLLKKAFRHHVAETSKKGKIS